MASVNSKKLTQPVSSYLETADSEPNSINEARSFIRQQREQEIAIEARIRYLQGQDNMIEKQVEQARRFVTKKKVI